MRPRIALEQFEVFAEGLDHPEGLAFDADGNLWAGGELGQVYRIDPRGRVKTVATLGGFHLGVTLSVRQELYFCNTRPGALVHVSRSGKILHSWDRVGSYRFRNPNFSVFDSDGNLYFTDSGEWMRDDGYIFVLRPSGRIERLAGSLAFPNGMALSADERTLFVVQSTRDNVLAFPLKGDGTLGRGRVYARDLHRVPDGAALDSAGNLLVTCYASDNVYEVSPSGKISLYAYDPMGTMIARPTNAAFGGANFDQVYFANLGRWHICRAPARVSGQPLLNQR